MIIEGSLGLKILHVFPRFLDDLTILGNIERIGGAERYVMNLCRAQRNLGHDSTLMLFAARETEFEVDGIPILTVRARPFVHGVNQNFDPVPRELGRFVCALASYDVIHTHNLACDASFLLSVIRKVTKKHYGLLVTDHGWNGLTLGRVFITSKPMMKFSGFDGLLPVTRASSSSYQKYTRVFNPLYGGVNPEVFRRLDGERQKNILFVGRLTPYKKVDNLIRAISFLEDKPKLIVIGPTLDQQYRASLERLANELEVDTSFLGRISDQLLVDYYSSATALVLPSIDELFGLVLLEAMACELPVVGNKAGGVPEAVDDGKTGYLVRQGDIKQLTDRLRLLLTDQQEATRLGIAGRQRVLLEFTWRHVAERSLSAYREVLQ